ncbi:MAG: DUF393 domain-containing protein [Chlamydiota bacterium]
MHEHLIFYDDECPLCHKAVRQILEIDQDQCFLFAPLNGETADDVLSGPQAPLRRMNSLVLAENYRSTDRSFWIRSRAIFRVYWLIGRGWAVIGLLSFLPGWFGDLLYRWLAEHRHQFKLQMPEDPGPSDRFLK